MFPSFIGILDIQSWWEVPSIAYFCSLFRTAFNLLDFDIEELEEALLTDGTEESASSLLTELIVRLLNGCLGNNDISAFNYQMYLRRLFRRKCQETGRYNPFNTDIDFQFLPLRTKVEILYALCDFRLDANDIFDLFKNLEAESLRVEPLGWDDNDSAYWYFYGTRLYREDILKKPKGKNKKKKGKENKKRGWFYGDDWLDDEETERVWQVVCFTEEDWTHLTEKFSKATSKVEKELYRSLSQNFLPEIPRLFQEKERLQRKRLLELAPRRTSSRVLQKIKQKEEEDKPSDVESKDQTDEDKRDQARENRAKRRNLIRSKSESSDSSDNSSSDKEMPQKAAKRPKGQDKRSKNSSATHKGEPPPDQPVKTGRKTNNSLANATGQIVIPDSEEPANSTRKKLKTSQIFSQTEEDVQTDMYKVLEQLTAHEDAWPFMDPVEEEYAPNYYAVIRRPMDLHKMEERLDTGYYTDFSMFKADFKLIVNNCRLYNGQDNEYTMMVDNLQAAFDRLTEKYIHRLSSSDEEIAVEFQLPTPSRKHKLKTSESPTNHKRKKRKSHSDGGEGKSSHHEEEEDPPSESPAKESKESHHKSKDGKLKKKRKGHHRHGKHSKNHKKDSHHKSEHGSKSSKHSRKQKHGKDKDTKRSKKKTKKNKQVEEPDPALVRSASKESLESSNRSRSARPLPSIHTPSPEPSPPPAEPLSDPDFFKDKYDKIKERRRHAAKDAWESLFDYKQNKQKQNLHIPEKEKNQKLRETIEKLKAKNEKYKDGLFKNLFSAGKSSDKNSDSTSTTKESLSKDQDDSDFTDEETKELPSKEKHKSDSKKTIKKHTSAKNESASEALEQAVKDISKWLDDAPKGSSTSSPCDSPAQTISTEEQDNSRQDDEFLQDKSLLSRKEMARKRPSSREPKILKRREIQRTIDRLQPGKSKGNLLTTKKDVEKVEEIPPAGASLLNKAREASKSDESSPKLSLGSVLATVEFTLGNDHNFDKSDEAKPETKKGVSTQDATEKDAPKAEVTTETKTVDAAVETVKEDQVVDTETTVMKPSQEKATPNLSAWFKAFGTPKSTTTTTTVKKRPEEEQEEKPVETLKEENKASSPKHPAKYDSPTEVESGTPEGGDSPLPAATATPRARRISTGSSVSERSSFSQDLDSPRHQISHTSPLLRSPASPRTDDFQKITYPIINGTVRAGFYQDTTSIKSSPEKSCSPREGPQSPYSPYSQHVYASNNAMGSSTPNYFADHNKSPLPTYGQNQPPPYYDTTKAAVVPKPRVHEDYTALGPDSFQQSTFGGPPPSPFSQGQPASYSQPQLSPAQTPAPPSPAPALPVTPAAQLLPDPKTALFPVKKRTYNEADTSVKKAPEVKENAAIQNKSEYQKMVQSIHTMSSVDDIAVALTEKSELAKINSLREKSSVEYMDRISIENRDTPIYDKTEHSNKKKETASVDPSKAIGMTKNDNIDMVNMGYMNPDNERRSSGDHEINFSTAAREAAIKSNMNPQPKGYEIDTIAMNLGLNNHNAQKAATKPSVSSGAIPPAHSQERSAADLLTVQNHHMMQQHAEYAENMAASGQSTNNFSLNDIELANKKLYSCSTPSNTALDYGNWKMTNQMRKQDVLPSDYAAYNAGNAEKMKTDVNTANAAALNYNKNLQQQQYHNYNAPRTTLQNLPSELRIPNPRGYLKNDHMSVPSSHSNSEIISKNVDTSAKSQKSDKIIQNHPLVGSLQYKTPYSTHSSLPLDSLRNLPNIPQMLERYTNDERYLSSFATASGSSLYHDKSFQMAQMSQMFNKSIASEVHPTSTSVSAYSQASTTMSKETSIYKTSPNLQSASVDAKSKTKRKRTSESKQTQQVMGNQSFHTSSCTSDVLSSVKSGMVPGSAFNFGASSNMALGSGLYGDNGSFSIEDLRNSTANQLMAANYMAAAAAARQPAGADTPPRQPGGAFPWAGSSGVRGAAASYATSPLYQQYLQRHQEELLRQTGAQIMGLYPPGYPAALAARQPYDRPSWL